MVPAVRRWSVRCGFIGIRIVAQPPDAVGSRRWRSAISREPGHQEVRISDNDRPAGVGSRACARAIPARAGAPRPVPGSGSLPGNRDRRRSRRSPSRASSRRPRAAKVSWRGAPSASSVSPAPERASASRSWPASSPSGSKFCDGARQAAISSPGISVFSTSAAASSTGSVAPEQRYLDPVLCRQPGQRAPPGPNRAPVRPGAGPGATATRSGCRRQ